MDRSLALYTASADEAQQYGHDGQHQQDVNQTSDAIHKDANKPADDEDNGNDIQ